MKRKMIFMALLLCGMLTACSQSKKAESKETGKDPKKVLVAYFSASGVTEGVAKLLAETTGGELHRIQPEQPYTEADLDWRDKKSRSTIEMADKTSRPAITDKLDGVDGFDVIYVDTSPFDLSDDSEHLHGGIRLQGKDRHPLRHIRRQHHREGL